MKNGNETSLRQYEVMNNSPTSAVFKEYFELHMIYSYIIAN